jgi:hypothetical protein
VRREHTDAGGREGDVGDLLARAGVVAQGRPIPVGEAQDPDRALSAPMLPTLPKMSVGIVSVTALPAASTR